MRPQWSNTYGPLWLRVLCKYTVPTKLMQVALSIDGPRLTKLQLTFSRSNSFTATSSL